VETRALVLALALTLPLALYAIPFAYAVGTQSTYVVKTSPDLSTGLGSAQAKCSSALDSTEHYGYTNQNIVTLLSVFPVNSGGSEVVTGDNPNGWRLIFSSAPGAVTEVYIICQSPITVAGVGVPEFGSLYAAIALGAVAYFMLSRRFGRKTVTPLQG
jgi:hypothetical protein